MIEADIKYPTDAGLAAHGVTASSHARKPLSIARKSRSLAREGRKLAAKLREKKTTVRDRSRSMGRKLRAISRTIRRRSGEAKAEALALTEQTGQCCSGPSRRRAGWPRPRAARHVAAARRPSSGRLEGSTSSPIAARRSPSRSSKVFAGEKITDRLISLSDPDARPIRKGKLGKPNEFGYVAQIAEITPNTKRGARGLILPAASQVGNPGENALLPQTVTELQRLGISPREVALDGGFTTTATTEQLEDLDPERVFISGRQQPGSRRTQRRLQRYRTGAEGRISHLKRGYGMRRSRLKGDDDQKTWTGWGILTYNLDTLAIRTA